MKVHLRYQGRSRTLEASYLGIDSETPSEKVKDVLARVMEIPAGALSKLSVDRSPDGIVVRPPAIFG